MKHFGETALGTYTRITRMLCGGILASNILFASPAFAVDATDFIDGLQTEMSKRGNSLTFQSMEGDGAEGAVLKQVVLEDGKAGTVIKIDTLSLSGTRQLGENGYQFDAMQAEGLVMTSVKNGAENVLAIKQIAVTDFSYPDIADREYSFWPLNMGSGKFTSVRMDGKGKDQFSALFPSIQIDQLQSTGGNAFSLGKLDSETANGSFINAENTEGTFVLGAIKIDNAAFFGGNGYSIETAEIGAMTFDGTNEKEQKIAVGYDGLSAANLYSPDFSLEEDAAWPEEEMVFNSRGARFSLDGKDVFTMKGAVSNTRYSGVSKSYETVAKVDDIFVNMDAIPVSPGQEASRKQFTDLGYSSLNLDLDMKGVWNIESGKVDVEQYRLSATDMMSVDISSVIGGFTRDFARQIAKISNKIGAADDEIKQAFAMQMLALYSGITIDKLKIWIEDDSLTKRLMEQQALKSGQEAKDLALAVPFMAGAVLSQFNVPDFAASASNALGAFLTSALNNEGSLTLSANPPEPVSFAEIFGIASGFQAGNVEPSEIIDRFGIAIDAE